MDIGTIRTQIGKGNFFVTDHALIESFNDGTSLDEIIWAINHGEVLESYPERGRCLVHAKLSAGIHAHVVVDYSSESGVEIVTVYIPDSKLWIRGRKRKR